jgi:hypothetical protein
MINVGRLSDVGDLLFPAGCASWPAGISVALVVKSSNGCIGRVAAAALVVDGIVMPRAEEGAPDEVGGTDDAACELAAASGMDASGVLAKGCSRGAARVGEAEDGILELPSVTKARSCMKDLARDNAFK